MRTYALKIRIFHTWTRVGGGEVSQCGHFADKEEGSIFRDFVRTSFMDGTLREKFNDYLFLYKHGLRSSPV